MEHSAVDRDSNLEQVPFKQETDESIEHRRAVYTIEFGQGNLVLDVGLHIFKALGKNASVYRAQKAIDMCSKNASSQRLLDITRFIMRDRVALGVRTEIT
jgi:hypothetical protein